MRTALAPIAALILLSACEARQPTPQEEALPQTADDPELTANSAAAGLGNASTATGAAADRAPGGPVSDQGGTAATR